MEQNMLIGIVIDGVVPNAGWKDRVIKCLKEIDRLAAEKENLLSGHFCPNPQLSKISSECDCAHSDRHRKKDWETIDRLTKELQEYGQHKNTCISKTFCGNWTDELVSRKCDCGFEQILKGE